MTPSVVRRPRDEIRIPARADLRSFLPLCSPSLYQLSTWPACLSACLPSVFAVLFPIPYFRVPRRGVLGASQTPHSPRSPRSLTVSHALSRYVTYIHLVPVHPESLYSVENFYITSNCKHATTACGRRELSKVRARASHVK